MTTFQSVNVGLPKDHQLEVTTPTTPRAPVPAPPQPPPTSIAEEQGSETPTRLSFSGMGGQRPLPTSPFRSSFTSSSQSTDQSRPSLPSRENSHRSTGSQDIDMDESDEGDGGSDEESVDAETGRPTKKKKGQRFFCTSGSFSDLCPLTHADADDTPGSTLANARFSVIAPEGFRGLTTCANTPRPFTSMKKYREILSRQQAPASSGKFARIACARLQVAHEPLQLAVKEAMAEGIAGIYQLRALALPLRPSAEGTTIDDVRRPC
ncbi:MAG: hypothetical protein Q9190_007416 [Brigantiaea leucoxantha]